MPDMITLENLGPDLVRSNYWQSAYARNGYYYLSVNAGCLRLLVPEQRESEVAEMLSAHEVVVTVGPYRQADGRPMIEILFDDHTATPFALHLCREQTDRGFADAGDLPRRFLIYTAGCRLVGELTWYYREAELPCLKPLV